MTFYSNANCFCTVSELSRLSASQPRNAPLKILVVINGLRQGGAEVQLVELSKVAAQAGIELMVCALRDPGEIPSGGNSVFLELKAMGVPVFTTHFDGHISPKALVDLYRLASGLNPSLIHTHLADADLLGGLTATLLRVPWVSTIHEVYWPLEQRRAQLQRSLLSGIRQLLAKRVIVVSEGARIEYNKQWSVSSKRVVTIRGGMTGEAQPGAGVEVRQQLGIGPDEIVLAMLSTVRPEKRHDIALATFGLLRERFPKLRFVIVGGPAGYIPSAYKTVVKAVEEFGEGVVMTGPRSDVMTVLDAVDLMLQPSDSEGYPTSLLEAAAAGVPVVASRVGGIPEIVDDNKTGFLVDKPLRPALFAEVAGRLIEDPNLRAEFGKAARKRFEVEFRAQGWAERLRAVYDDVIAQTHSPGTV